MKWIAELLKGERGQDLIEYTLLLAFVMMASAALYVNAGGGVAGLWGTANASLNAATSQAEGS